MDAALCLTPHPCRVAAACADPISVQTRGNISGVLTFPIGVNARA